MFSNNVFWQQVQAYLPEENRLTKANMPTEKTVSYHDIEIRYDEYIPKDTSNNTIIIFHGVGGNGRLLSFLAVPLSKAGFNVICPDLPGYGYTKIDKLFDYSTWIEVGKFIVNREIQAGRNAYVFGLSAGGMLAYNVTCKVKNVKGLIITNILDNRLQIVRDYSAKNKLQSRIGIKILDILPTFLKRIKIPVKMVANMKKIVNNSELLTILLKDKVGAGSSISIYFLLSMMNSIPLIEPEEFNLCPVLLVHPEVDKWTPIEISRLFFDRIQSQKEIKILNNAGHFPIETPGLQQLENSSIAFLFRYGN